MQLETLKAFCDLAEAQSFTKSAEMNGVTQSAVSQCLTGLEERYGVLVEGRGASFKVTAKGQALYECGKGILEVYEALQRKLEEVRSTVSSNVRVVTTSSIGLEVVPRYLRKFSETCPTVKVHVEYCKPEEVYRRVLEGVAEIGFVVYPLKHPGLEVMPLGKERLVLICHPQHQLAKLGSVKVEELRGERFVSLKRDDPTRQAIDSILSRERITVYHVVEGGDLYVVKRVVELGDGVAIVPAAMVRENVTRGTLAAVPVEGDYFRPLAAIRGKLRNLSGGGTQFMALLKQPL